jgi:hypothetical protein
MDDIQGTSHGTPAPRSTHQKHPADERSPHEQEAVLDTAREPDADGAPRYVDGTGWMIGD